MSLSTELQHVEQLFRAGVGIVDSGDDKETPDRHLRGKKIGKADRGGKFMSTLHTRSEPVLRKHALLSPVRQTLRGQQRRDFHFSKRRSPGDCELKYVHGKSLRNRLKVSTVDPKNVDEMTCRRAPIEPLSPKSPEVVEQIAPLGRGARGRYPDRWYDQRTAIKDVLAQAKKEAFLKDCTRERCREWERNKRRLTKRQAAAVEQAESVEKMKALDRKNNSEASYRLWKAQKNLHLFQKRMTERRYRFPKSRVSKREKLEMAELEFEALKAKKQMALQLRSQGELQALASEPVKKSTNSQSGSARKSNNSEEAKDKSEKKKAQKRSTNVNREQASLKLTACERVCGSIKLLIDTTKSRLRDAFNDVDSNGDGTVEEAEFAALVGSLGIDADLHTVGQAFSQLDRDGSRFITYDELFVAVRAVPPRVVQSLLREEKRKRRVKDDETRRYYETLKDKISPAVKARLKHPILFSAMHTWKVAKRARNLNPKAVRKCVEANLVVVRALDLMRESLYCDKAKFINMFVDMDQNADGTIDIGELRSVLHKLGIEQKQSKRTALQIVKKVDRDKDGRLEYLELVRALKSMDRQRTQQKIKRDESLGCKIGRYTGVNNAGLKTLRGEEKKGKHSKCKHKDAQVLSRVQSAETLHGNASVNTPMVVTVDSPCAKATKPSKSSKLGTKDLVLSPLRGSERPTTSDINALNAKLKEVEEVWRTRKKMVNPLKSQDKTTVSKQVPSWRMHDDKPLAKHHRKSHPFIKASDVQGAKASLKKHAKKAKASKHAVIKAVPGKAGSELNSTIAPNTGEEITEKRKVSTPITNLLRQAISIADNEAAAKLGGLSPKLYSAIKSVQLVDTGGTNTAAPAALLLRRVTADPVSFKEKYGRFTPAKYALVCKITQDYEG